MEGVARFKNVCIQVVTLYIIQYCYTELIYSMLIYLRVLNVGCSNLSILCSTLRSPVCPCSVLIPPCPSCLCLLPLCLILRRTLRPGPRPASGSYVCCSPASHDLSSADAASSSLLTSSFAARGHRRRERSAVIPAGRGSSVSPVKQRANIVKCSSVCTEKALSIFSLGELLCQEPALNCLRRLTISYSRCSSRPLLLHHFLEPPPLSPLIC